MNKTVCGCIGPSFIQNAKRNHYCALRQAGNTTEKYRDFHDDTMEISVLLSGITSLK